MKFPSDGSSDPVAVVAGIEVNGLGVLRSLGLAGVPTLALDTTLDKSASFSRFAIKRQVPALHGDLFVEALLGIAKMLKHKPVLFLTQEESVATVAAAQSLLIPAYNFTMPSKGIMDLLLDKQAFQELAEEMGSLVPRSVRLTTDSGAERLANLRFPCVLKPTTKSPAYSASFRKAYKLYSAFDAVSLWQEIRKVASEVIVQEWIEGDDSDVYFCLQYRQPNRNVRVSFVGRKVRQWPRSVGGTASCIPAPEFGNELAELTEDFFARAGFVGLGSMEYKRDSRDGKFYMVEPTVGRTDYQEEIATLNGVNIPNLVYCAELGMPLPSTQTVTPPRAWRDSVSDKRAQEAGASQSIRQLAPTAKIVDALFRLDDPKPYLRELIEPVLRRAERFGAGR